MKIRKEMTNTVYIGYDSREHTAYEVLKFSIERIAAKNCTYCTIKKDDCFKTWYVYTESLTQ